MRVALYARVSTEAQEARGTIGSQLDVIKARIAEEGHELVAEFSDDGFSGARLDRPGLDALRDAAEAGLFEAVWCLSPDRLARAYAYQMLVLDELERFHVRMLFTDAPALDDDPQARLLTQIQGVIAEYEKAKIAERYRRGKLWRSRGGEIISWKTPYGYRRVPRVAEVPAHLEVFESEAIIVRRIFEDYVAGGHSIRQICRLLNVDKVPSPTGNPVWGHSTVSRLLRNEAYVGRVYYNRTESVPTTSKRGRRSNLQRPRQERVDLHPRATDHPRDDLRRSTDGQPGQLQVEPPQHPPRCLDAARPGEVRALRRRRQLPSDAGTQRDRSPLLLVPKSRHRPVTRRAPPLPGAQHQSRRARCLRL